MALFESLIPPEWGAAVIAAERVPFWAGTLFLLALTIVCFYLIFAFIIVFV